MALRNLVHFYSPNPFGTKTQKLEVGSASGQEQGLTAVDKSITSLNNKTIVGPYLHQKDFFL